MTLKIHRIKCAVATNILALLLPLTVAAQTDTLDVLFDKLADPELERWEDVENEIWAEWSRSGSASADLMLERGREAMAEQNLNVAIEHLTALTDHAPEFAEGFNARATAYFQAEMYGASIRDIEMTLALNPKHFGALSGLGMIFEGLGDDELALRAYEEVAAIHPHRPNVKDAIERLEARVAGTDL